MNEISELIMKLGRRFPTTRYWLTLWRKMALFAKPPKAEEDNHQLILLILTEDIEPRNLGQLSSSQILILKRCPPLQRAEHSVQ